MKVNEKLEEILNKVNPEIMEFDGENLIEEDILDSFMVMQIVSLVEEAFEIDFDPEDIAAKNFASPEDIWKTIQKYGV